MVRCRHDLEVEWCGHCTPRQPRKVGLNHMVWISETETAARFHDRDDCNAFTAALTNSPNAKQPVQITVEQARAMGRTPCQLPACSLPADAGLRDSQSDG